MQPIPQSDLPTIGSAFAGGFFGGLINVNGTLKAVIWSPKAQGYIEAALLEPDAIDSSIAAHSPCDSEANTQALLNAGSPAAKLVMALNINGFTDWVIPARDVLELGYRHLKPTVSKNYCSWRDGENPYSVPAGWLYTEKSPAQTMLKAFQKGGEEAFEPGWHRSSTLFPSGNSAFVQHFLTGYQYYSRISNERLIRAVRLIPVTPSTL